MTCGSAAMRRARPADQAREAGGVTPLRAAGGDPARAVRWTLPSRRPSRDGACPLRAAARDGGRDRGADGAGGPAGRARVRSGHHACRAHRAGGAGVDPPPGADAPARASAGAVRADRAAVRRRAGPAGRQVRSGRCEHRLATLDPGGRLPPDADGAASRALAWVVAGAVIAGTPAERGQHSFYDPSRGSGLAQAGGAVPARVRAAAAPRRGRRVPRRWSTGTDFNLTGRPATEWLAAPENDVGLAASRQRARGRRRRARIRPDARRRWRAR